SPERATLPTPPCGPRRQPTPHHASARRTVDRRHSRFRYRKSGWTGQCAATLRASRSWLAIHLVKQPKHRQERQVLDERAEGMEPEIRQTHSENGGVAEHDQSLERPKPATAPRRKHEQAEDNIHGGRTIEHR